MARGWFGLPIDVSEMDWGPTDMLDGVPGMFENVFWAVKNQVQGTLQILILLLLMRIIFRKAWLAIAAFMVIVLVAFGPTSENLLFDKLFTLVIGSFFVFTLVRGGLLTVCVGMFLLELSHELPMTLDFSLWYSGGFFVLLLVTFALLAYGFRFSLAGRSMFADSALDG